MTAKYFEVNKQKLKVTVEWFTDVNEQVKDSLDSLLAHGHHVVKDKVTSLQGVEKSALVHFKGGRKPLRIDFPRLPLTSGI